MSLIKRIAPQIAYFATLFTVSAVMGFVGLYLAVGPGLPDVESIREIRLQTPMSIYSGDKQLISEIGDIRRIPITLDQVPQDFINALLDTEDQRFYEHSGVDLRGVFRAVFKLITTQTKSEGASTITMQVARNYYLDRGKRFSRKFTEMFLAWKIEAELSKDEILALYLNKIHFSHRAFGLGAASQVYYGTTLNQLSLGQLATLAGIPKGPSVNNPISYPERAKKRRSHVLGRMLAENHITQSQYDEAVAEPIRTRKHGTSANVDAPYVAEMVRKHIVDSYGRDAINDGLKVYTTVDARLQGFANQALVEGLEEYDRRHGYRGPEQKFDLSQNIDPSQLSDWLKDIPVIANLQPALVTEVNDDTASLLLKNNQTTELSLEAVKWARAYVDENYRGPVIKKVSDVLQPGDLVRVREIELSLEALAAMDEIPPPQYKLAQIPDVSGGLVSLSPETGAIEALVGGYNYTLNKFNMVTQARRQPGSNIKPFVYSAAFNKDYTPASMINDMPIVEADITAENFWRPKNDGDSYLGPTSLRNALRRSKNTVSVRLIREVGPRYTKSYLEQIGFPGEHMPPYLSLALGSASFTPLEVVKGYAVLANGGYKVEPWFIQRIEDANGQILFEQQPTEVCRTCEEIIARRTEQQLASENTLAANQTQSGGIATTEGAAAIKSESLLSNPVLEQDQQTVISSFHNLPELPIPENKIAPRVIEARNHFLVDDILKDAIHRGTATRTLTRSKSPLLKRSDIAGKTGTTNDAKDAWFSGYNRKHVATTWVGFSDHSRKLGVREFGGIAALPVWQKFMEKALAGAPQDSHPRPEGIVTVRIDPENGKLASSLTKSPQFELFRSENAPTEYSEKPIEELLDQDETTVEDDGIW